MEAKAVVIVKAVQKASTSVGTLLRCVSTSPDWAWANNGQETAKLQKAFSDLDQSLTPFMLRLQTEPAAKVKDHTQIVEYMQGCQDIVNVIQPKYDVMVSEHKKLVGKRAVEAKFR